MRQRPCIVYFLSLQVHLSGGLSSSTTQAYQLQQEMVNLQQRVTEIQADLSAALEDKHKHCAQISLLEEQVKGDPEVSFKFLLGFKFGGTFNHKSGSCIVGQNS